MSPRRAQSLLRRMLELMGAIRVRIAHCIYLGTAPPPTPRLPPGKASPGTQYPSASPADVIYLEIVARMECSEIRGFFSRNLLRCFRATFLAWHA